MFLNFLSFASKLSCVFYLSRIFLLCIYPEQNLELTLELSDWGVTLPMTGDWSEMSFEFPSNPDHSGFL